MCCRAVSLRGVQPRQLPNECLETVFLELLCAPECWSTVPTDCLSAAFSCFFAYFAHFAFKANHINIPISMAVPR